MELAFLLLLIPAAALFLWYWLYFRHQKDESCDKRLRSRDEFKGKIQRRKGGTE